MRMLQGDEIIRNCVWRARDLIAAGDAPIGEWLSYRSIEEDVVVPAEDRGLRDAWSGGGDGAGW